MKLIKNNDAFKKSNGDKCDVFEYSFDDKEIDLGVAIIKGRYPEQGFCMNLVSKELIYVIKDVIIIHITNVLNSEK